MDEMRLRPEETLLTGGGKSNNKSMERDAVSERIYWLVAECLIEISKDESGWIRLYRDPEDNRYWELTYPESESHGGGYPQLQQISVTIA